MLLRQGFGVIRPYGKLSKYSIDPHRIQINLGISKNHHRIFLCNYTSLPCHSSNLRFLKRNSDHVFGIIPITLSSSRSISTYLSQSSIQVNKPIVLVNYSLYQQLRHKVTRAHYDSIQHPDTFWKDAAKDIRWMDDNFTSILDQSNPPFYKWFSGGKLNTCYNCIDRHIDEGHGDRLALIYDSPVTNTIKTYKYNEIVQDITKLAHVLIQQGVGKGDPVIIYMPNIPEAVIAMLACARIGAIHSVVFGGFAAPELAVRIRDCKPKAIISTSVGVDGNKYVQYKPLLDKAIELSANDHKVSKTIIFQRNFSKCDLIPDRDIDWESSCANVPPNTVIPCVPLDSNDPLYILYTSGTTGSPKGVLRDNGGHAVALKWAMKNIFDVHSGEVFWAASDVGWVVGHSFSVYGPLLQGCTTVIYEGKPVGTPDAANFWRTIERHKVVSFFTAPTALRAIKREDRAGNLAKTFDLSHLRSLFLAGEHADKDTLHWAEHSVHVPIIDNWWQTETGWPICTNAVGLDGLLPVKYGSCFRPVPGYDLQVLDDKYEQVSPGTMGNLAIKLPLPPGSFLTLYNSDSRFKEAYMTKIPGYYDTGDAGIIDEDGYVYVMSRTDDVINVAGHRLSTGAMEEILSEHPDIAEAAVVGIKDTFRGQIPLGLMVLSKNCKKSEDDVSKEVIELVRQKIGPVAFFKKAVVVSKLPKTRSGKVLRSTLRNIANGEKVVIPATCEDPSAIDEAEKVIKEHANDNLM